MYQVLFHVFGFPIPSFGAMLVVALAFAVVWGSRRAARVGLPPTRFQDMLLWVIIGGFIGARILYMIQYSQQFPDKSVLSLVGAFFQIWKGGIIFYGSALGGTLGYAAFYWLVLRRMRINVWQLADAVAPLIALGIAIGRVGCLLNGCCWGQVACESTCTVPLGAIHFPLLPAHARDQVVERLGLQTSTGFGIQRPTLNDPRSVVTVVEADSAAARAGVQPGDKIVQVNGQPNAAVLEFAGPAEKVDLALQIAKDHGADIISADRFHAATASFARQSQYAQARQDLDDKGLGDVVLRATDTLDRLVRWDWPRGLNPIKLGVERDGQQVEIPPFVPRTVGFYPTQIYESISMGLLTVMLLAYHPFRRHDGQLMTILMMGYAIHRFLNESLRIEPVVGLGLTLSQWGSVVVFAAGLVMEVGLWMKMPSRWKSAPSNPPSPETPKSL